MSGTIQGFSKELTLTVKCFFGFEETLIEELHEFGFKKITKLNRAVQLKGNWKGIGKQLESSWKRIKIC